MLFVNLRKKFSRQQLYNSGLSRFNDDLKPSNKFKAARNESFVPPFAFNDDQLRMVLCHRSWRYLHTHKEAPASWDYAAVNKDATSKALAGYEIDVDAGEIQREAQAKHIAAVKCAGGYMELCAAIAWRSWRLGMPSPEVAASLGVTPWMVRQSLRRLRGIAASLGFEVGRRHHSLRSGLSSPSNGWSH